MDFIQNDGSLFSMEKIDYKKVCKELYQPKTKPEIVDVPPMCFLQIGGQGDPNDADGEYQQAVEILYTLSYTIKMFPKKGVLPTGYFDYVVPPLEGLWWMKNEQNFDFRKKSELCWIAMIRQPEFVTENLFSVAKQYVEKKKPSLDLSKAWLRSFSEGLSVQCMHMGSFDEESFTIDKMRKYVAANGYVFDLSMERRHHEIYLSDPRKIVECKMKTVLRYPINTLAVL